MYLWMVRNLHSLFASIAVEKSEVDARGVPPIIQLFQQAVHMEDVTTLRHYAWLATHRLKAGGTLIISCHGSG